MPHEASLAISVVASRDRTDTLAGMSHLIDAGTLLGRLGDADLRIIDARFDIAEPAAGHAAYRAGHVPGAIYFGLDHDLSGPASRHGGRHPLPDMERFARTLAERGIGDRHQVVVLDQSGTMYAARAWWLLRYAGHDAVRFLDGGMAAYLAAGGEVVTSEVRHPPATFTLRLRPEMAVDVAHVAARIGDPATLMIDARTPERYRGEVEPFGPIAGHVPGARNLYYQDTMGATGFRPPSELRRVLAMARGKDEVVTYCGSGVSGAHLVLALEEAGFPGAKLYVGSWSDWSSYDDLPVATGDEVPPEADARADD